MDSILSKYDNKDWSNNEWQILNEMLSNYPGYQLVVLPPDKNIAADSGTTWFSTQKKVLKNTNATKTANGVATFDILYLDDDRKGEHYVTLNKGYIEEKMPETTTAKPNNTKKYLIYGGIGLAAIVTLAVVLSRN